MTPGSVWLDQQGEDSFLLHAVSHAFPRDRDASIGVAVSGGGDSVALLHAAARVGTRLGRKVSAATVDHGLRPEAADEARQVAHLCATLRIPHKVLRWDEPVAQSGNLQARARDARYRLLARWAADEGLASVLLGHTADDQAETFVMRLARKSGVDGLSCMDPTFRRDGVCFLRPLSDLRRADLRDYLLRNAVTWCEDPSNEDRRFDRARARSALRHLADIGIGTAELTAVSENMTVARDALAVWARHAAGDVMTQDRGDLVFDDNAFHALPLETRRRLLLAALHWIGGAVYPQRSGAISALEDAIRNRLRMTLGGCILHPDGDGAFRLTREWNAVRAEVCSTAEPWDRGRWHLTGPHADGTLIRALGEDGILRCPTWRDTGLPRQSLLASPSIWRGADLIAAPLAGLESGWTAQLAKGRDIFVDSIASH